MGADEVATIMEQEGCGGCAENFLCAIESGDVDRAVQIAHESMAHIRQEGYRDAWANGGIASIQVWVDETLGRN
jgi:hypothetical protein